MRILIGSAAIACILSSTTTAVAQIVVDDSLKAEHSVLTPNVQSPKGQIDRIDGGAIRGSNLFHSFQDFNVGNQQRVYFSNPSGVENILGRVTGNHASNIFGTLGVLGNANLYLINPHGIIFGNNARLDISGSFFASTSNALIFKNGYQFTTQDPQAPPLLTVNQPLGLDSWLPPQSAIANSGNLSVGQDLTLVGKNLDLQGQLQAGGNLTLQATNTLKVRDSLSHVFIASAEQQLLAQGNKIDISALNNSSSGFFSGKNMVFRSAKPIGGDAQFFSGGNFSLEQMDGQKGDLTSFDDSIIRANGDVSFNNYTGASIHIFAGGSVTINNIQVNSSETNNFINETVTLSDGVTQIPIRGGDQPTVDIRAGTTNFNPTGIQGNTNIFSPTPSTVGQPTSADITINQIINSGGLVFLTNQYQPNNALSGNITIKSALNIFGSGEKGGDIVIDSRGKIVTPQFISSYGIDASSLAYSKPGGDITLLAHDDIVMPPSSRIVSAGTAGGNITLKSQSAIIQEQATRRQSFIESASYGAGQGGNVSLNAPFIFLSNDVKNHLYKNATVTGGNLIITANTLETNNAELSTISNVGNAGKVLINADEITLNNSKIGSQSIGVNAGKAGDIEINTISLIANNSQIFSQIEGIGNAGNIVIEAQDKVILSGANTGLSSYTTLGSIGNGSNIFVNAKIIEILDGAAISTDSQGRGVGGSIDIQANILTLDNQALISAKTASTEGANINLQLADALSLRRGSRIWAIAGNETTGGNGANITINTGLLFAVPEENSDISANAFSGNGGKIEINAREIQGIGFSQTDTPFSNITSSSKPEVPNPPPEVLNLPPEIPNPPPEVPNFPPEVPTPTPGLDFSSLGSIDEPDAAPSSAVIELPNPQSTRDNQIVTASCAAKEGNSFTITGKGGLPTDPTATIRGQTLLSDTRDFTTTQSSSQANQSSAIPPTRQQIVAATAWIINVQGQVELVASLPQETSPLKEPNCSDL